MRRYSPDEEERIRAQQEVRAWARAGLLDRAQAAMFEEELRTDLKRTNAALRAGLALFTVFIVAASVLLVGVELKVRSETAVAILAGLSAAACLALAEFLVGAFRLYRYGVEEALAVSAAVLASLSAGAIAVALLRTTPGSGWVVVIAGLTTGAVAAFGIYRRFGFVYAAVGAMGCAALIAFQLHVAEPVQRMIAAATLASVFAVARARRLQHGDDFPGDECATLQAAAWAGIYLTLNLQLWSLVSGFLAARPVERWFYWCTYAAVWLLPAVGLRLGIRQRDRGLIDVSLLMALATLVTNKPYLGWPRHPWDPILLGMLLVGTAVVLRRWLASGPAGVRGGFTASQLQESQKNAIAFLATASAAFQPYPEAPSPAPSSSDFAGGRSGGGGGGAGF